MLKKYEELKLELQQVVIGSWEHPIIPETFTSAVVTLMSSGNVTLDFISEASSGEYILRYSNVCGKPQCMWPWIPGYKPTKEDWQNLGFVVATGRDSSYLTDTSHYFESWIGINLP